MNVAEMKYGKRLLALMKINSFFSQLDSHNLIGYMGQVNNGITHHTTNGPGIKGLKKWLFTCVRSCPIHSQQPKARGKGNIHDIKPAICKMEQLKQFQQQSDQQRSNRQIPF